MILDVKVRHKIGMFPKCARNLVDVHPHYESAKKNTDNVLFSHIIFYT